MKFSEMYHEKRSSKYCFGVYILLEMIWLILLIEILLLWMVDPLLWFSYLIGYLYFLWGVVFIIYFLVILYSDDYMFGDLNIIRFILLVLIFVVSITFLFISPNVISSLLGWDGLGLVSYFFGNLLS